MAVDQKSSGARRTGTAGAGRQRGAVRAAAVLVAVLAGLMLAGLPAGARAPGSAEYVKYYTVAPAYQGSPETLGAIAQRFLSSADRSVEIFSLNVGRTQVDGRTLSDPKTLRPGWQLVLPWDAVGTGVQYGLLPQKNPVPAPSGSVPAPAPVPPAGPAPAPGAESVPGQVPAAPGQSPAAGVPTNPLAPRAGNPAAVPSTAPKPTYRKGDCVVPKTSNSPSNWAALRLAPEQAWTHSRGKGQLVAIVDSGVDGSLAQLAGHVAVGADVLSAKGRGDTDCLSSGTGMAGIIVAQPTQGSPLSGIAPQATVMPVRIVDTKPEAKVADQAAGIELATSAGATVIALGAYVNTADAAVATAIATAVSRNIVVVMGAPTAATPAGTDLADDGAGVLRVGGVGVGGRAADAYRPGTVDVVAPGVNVTTLGVTGTGVLASNGTSYAVAFVAAEAALVRSAYPGLDAAQVTHRMKVTADKMADVVPDNRYGHGMINLAAAVTRELAEESPSVAAAARRTPGDGAASSGRTMAMIVVGLVGLFAAGLLAYRVRGLIRPEQDGPAGNPAVKPSDPADVGSATHPAGQTAADAAGRNRWSGLMAPSAGAAATTGSTAPRPPATTAPE